MRLIQARTSIAGSRAKQRETTTMSDRENLIEKIKALLSKTTQNGCTEHEELASLAKARAWRDAFEVTDAELKLSKEESAILRTEPAGTEDPHGIKSNLY